MVTPTEATMYGSMLSAPPPPLPATSPRFAGRGVSVEGGFQRSESKAAVKARRARRLMKWTAAMAACPLANGRQ